jgi:hypothetical protein
VNDSGNERDPTQQLRYEVHLPLQNKKARIHRAISNFNNGWSRPSGLLLCTASLNGL